MAPTVSADHRIIQQFGLEGTLKISYFQPPAVSRATFHWSRLIQTPERDFPLLPQVLLVNSEGLGFCGASIINEKWVVTAAHCLKPEYTHNLSAVAGEPWAGGEGHRAGTGWTRQATGHSDRSDGQRRDTSCCGA